MTDAAPKSHYTLERPEEAINPQAVYRELRGNAPVTELADGLELRYSPGIRQIDNLELVW